VDLFLPQKWCGYHQPCEPTLGCDPRINAKAIRMRKVVKCECFA
jgi:hypothetical protein